MGKDDNKLKENCIPIVLAIVCCISVLTLIGLMLSAECELQIKENKVTTPVEVMALLDSSGSVDDGSVGPKFEKRGDPIGPQWTSEMRGAQMILNGLQNGTENKNEMFVGVITWASQAETTLPLQKMQVDPWTTVADGFLEPGGIVYQRPFKGQTFFTPPLTMCQDALNDDDQGYQGFKSYVAKVCLLVSDGLPDEDDYYNKAVDLSMRMKADNFTIVTVYVNEDDSGKDFMYNISSCVSKFGYNNPGVGDLPIDNCPYFAEARDFPAMEESADRLAKGLVQSVFVRGGKSTVCVATAAALYSILLGSVVALFALIFLIMLARYALKRRFMKALSGM